MIIETAEIRSPVGTVTVALREGAMCGLSFHEHDERMERWMRRRFGHVEFRRVSGARESVARIRDYFDGDVYALDALAVDTGGTPFQQRVWQELRRIPAGGTVSYQELAAACGSSSAARAVGAANGANPVGIVIPCHRVVRADGDLGGYGGGVERKRWLLEHERRHARMAG